MFLYVTEAYKMFLHYLQNYYVVEDILLSICYKDKE